ncbi:kinase-like domain, phloem protein 2-like protein [Tanacetum coccineum]
MPTSRNGQPTSSHFTSATIPPDKPLLTERVNRGRDHMILVYELASKGSPDKRKIIHRDIKSASILLGDNWDAKIADFGLSKFHPANQEANTINTNMIASTNTYLDPEYQKYGRLNKKSDIYSFGVVLLEILTRSLAYDPVFTKVNMKGIAPIARDHFENGTLMEIVDRKIKEETDERAFSLSKGPDKESLDILSEIAFRCLAKTQVQRPTIEVVINELKKALYCQENHKDNLKLSLEDIKLATRSFSQENLFGHGEFGKVYKGHTHGHNIIAAKRLDRKSAEGEAKFMTELKILMEYKQENIIGLLGYCDEEDEKVIRLKICIDIATGMEFLHGTISSPEMVLHKDMSSSNILLFDEWKEKITNFGLSLVCSVNQDVVIDNVTGTIDYQDPLYLKTGFLTKESDIFSLGAVLFDILCGKLSSKKLDDEYLYLPFLAKQHYHLGKLDELVFEGIKERIEPESYITFTRIALQCIHHRRERRPTAHEVVIQLKKALEFQEDYEKWEPKLPYILPKRKRNSTTLLLRESFNRTKWFEKVAEMSDISNLNIEIKTDTQLLSPNIFYGVYLVFKFRDSRKFSTKPMYVNLKYRKGRETLQAYFAIQRDKNWMMIELYRFLNQNEDVVLKFLLECFSSYDCGYGAIYVEGIEFRATDKVKHNEIRYMEEVQQVLKSNFNVDQVQPSPTEEIFEIHKHNNYDELFWFGEINGKKLLVLSAKAVLYKFSDVDLFTSKPLAQSRFQEVIELLPQQVFYINCTFRSQMLSLDTEYVCYLVFKVSEESQGLDNPVRVRDLLREENEDAEFFIYLITPSPLNVNDITRVPKQREDGWMEIQLWKFNSTPELKDDSLSVNMKFTSHEGMLSGLIDCASLRVDEASAFRLLSYKMYMGSDRRFQHVLEACGVNKYLIKHGVKEGDTVIIGEMEMVWHDSATNSGPNRKLSTESVNSKPDRWLVIEKAKKDHLQMIRTAVHIYIQVLIVSGNKHPNLKLRANQTGQPSAFCKSDNYSVENSINGYMDSDRRFQHVLEACGVNKSLIKRGVKEGDTVIIGEMEMVWHDSATNSGPNRKLSTESVKWADWK